MVKVMWRCLRALDMWRKPWFLFMGADALSRQGPRPGEWMLHPDAVKQIWRVFGQAQVYFFATQEAMSPLGLSNSSSSTGVGCYGKDVAKASSVHLSPNRYAPGSSGESVPGRGQSTSGSTILAGPKYGSRT